MEEQEVGALTPDTKQADSRRHIRRRWILGILAALILLITVDYFLFPLLPMSGKSADSGRNGVWLRYTWYFGMKSDAEVRELAGRLRAGHFRDVYCHVRFIKPDGTLKFRKRDTARTFLRALRKEAPGVRAFAWIYIGSENGTPTVDVGNPKIRAIIIAEARWLIEECGFDGINWDYEIVRNHDPRLPALLREARVAMPTALHSVCTSPWYPAPVTSFYGWDREYFQEIARLSDQLTVMGYDTGMVLPRAYCWFMKKQTLEITRAVAAANPHCEVLIGVPSYGEGVRSHNPHAETLQIALKGIRNAAADRNFTPNTLTGVALFADYTTEPDEWAEFVRDWANTKLSP